MRNVSLGKDEKDYNHINDIFDTQSRCEIRCEMSRRRQNRDDPVPDTVIGSTDAEILGEK